MKTKITRVATILMVAASLITFGTGAKAQDYKNAIGLRGGLGSGITFKHFIKETAAIEVILSSYYYYQGANLTVLYEKHKYAFGTKEFRWLYGAGAHVGFFRGNDYWYRYHDFDHGYDNYYADNRRLVNIGIDAILGLEYKITEIPFTIGVDIKPYFDLIYFGNNYLDGALSVRYYW